MKAMILAAGLGTRLLPLTEKRPKPLFPILDRPLIDILIHRLQDAGCEAIIINTHHLGHMIAQFVEAQAYGMPVVTRNEPTIMGTGGGIRNVEDFWDNRPFIVVNGDIFTNVDLGEVYRFHLNHQHAATLVLHDYPQFNHVWVDPNNHVQGFGHTEPCPPRHSDSGERPVHLAHFRKLAFTGIQILDPQVLRFIPKGTYSSIIDAYCSMIRRGLTLKAFGAQKHYWYDIGTVGGYQEATRDAFIRKALRSAFPDVASESIMWSRLKGDGSDRTWYRVTTSVSEEVAFSPEGKAFASGQSTLIVVDHGPPTKPEACEADAFAAVGQHLYNKRIPVPRIFAYDRSSGLIALEDLGDLNIQQLVRRAIDANEVARHYESIIDLLVTFGVEGAKGFKPGFTYETPYYDRALILERESKYFVEAFLNGYLGLEINFEALEGEFDTLAQRALEHPYTGLLHRDFQSRNILIKDGKYYFIDFQGARFGPLLYDLASLLIDPYVELSQTLQERLLKCALQRLSARMPVEKNAFLQAYKYCAINRNLQIIGAFAFLSRVKGKKDFQAYIPPALRSLKQNLQRVEGRICKQLRRVVEGL